ncbi:MULTISPECIES: hypothetical protein [Streptacidiphilus]|uniref:Uncharacterized protein n=2 Tax=Streptacidiphilus TaxID=228398 RepID=A0ABV6UV33_9ACTN|nr:hypothetical protein [Streptacidiphilus jeojiense]
MSISSDWDTFEIPLLVPEKVREALPEASPVFVDHTGKRGRRLRASGWVLGVVCTVFAAGMLSNLVGAQAKAPALRVPATADTSRPLTRSGHPLVVNPTAP